MNKIGILILAVFSILFAANGSDEIFGDSFARQDAAQYFIGKPKVAFTAKADGKGNVLKAQSSIVFKKVAVTPDTRYILTFTASQEGSEPIEENPTLAGIIFAYRGQLYPVCRLFFFDEKGKRIGQVRGSNPFFAIPFGKPHEHKFVFYAPPKAVAMSLSFSMGKKVKALLLSDVSLKEENSEKIININPTFSLGEYNYSGISGFNAPDGRIIKLPDGKNALFTGFSVWTTHCPLKKAGSYLVKIRGKGYFKKRVDPHIVFLDINRKKISQVALPRPFISNEGYVEYRFKRPARAAYAYFWIYHGTVTEISLTYEGS